MFIKLSTTNDTNGNPRSLYVLVSASGAYVQAWNEGYIGYDAVPEEHREAARRAAHVETTPKFYREIKKTFVKE